MYYLPSNLIAVYFNYLTTFRIPGTLRNTMKAAKVRRNTTFKSIQPRSGHMQKTHTQVPDRIQIKCYGIYMKKKLFQLVISEVI